MLLFRGDPVRWILAGTLAALPVMAQVTGEYHRKMSGYGTSFSSVIVHALFLGLTVLVWLWVCKVWRELKKK